MIQETARSVLFLNRYYRPERSGTGGMLAELAEDLAKRGWRVTVVTGHPAGGGAGTRPAVRELLDGVRVVRVSTDGLGGQGRAGRVLSHLRSLAGFAAALLRLPRHHVVVAMTDPPLLILPALVVARIRHARVVHWVQELCSDRAEGHGIFRKGSWGDRGLRSLVRAANRRCDAVVSPGERVTEALLDAGAPSERVSCIHNWADTADIQPVPPELNRFRADHGLNGAFVVLYSGTAGRGHTFSAVMDAAWLLRDRPDILFLFIGGGQTLPQLEAEVWRFGLENVRFMGYPPHELLSESLSAAEVALVTEHPDVAGLRVPSKTYRTLASGRPVLFVGSERSEVARIVAANDCGIAVRPDAPEALVEALLRLKANPQEASAMGARARLAAIALYDRRIATGRWHDLLWRLTGAAARHRTDLPAAGQRWHPGRVRPRTFSASRSSVGSRSGTG